MEDKNYDSVSSGKTMVGCLFYLIGIGAIISLFVSGMSGTAIILMVIGLTVGYYVGESAENDRAIARGQDELMFADQLTNDNLEGIYEHACVPKDGTYYRWFFDDDTQKMVFFFDAKTPFFELLFPEYKYRLPLTSIIEAVSEYSYHIEGNTEHAGVIKRAVIGGVLAGGVGAVIGGATADTNVNQQKIIDRCWVRIQTNEVEYRTLKIYTDTPEMADDVLAIIKAIISKYADTPIPESALATE